MFRMLKKKAMRYLLLLAIKGCFVISATAQKETKTNLQTLDSLRVQLLHIVPENYYSSKLGFMCKKEIQMEKSTKIPFKIRLGSVDFVDKMEGKGSGRD